MLEIDPHAERVLHLVRQWVAKNEPVSLVEAERAVQVARRVRTQVRRRLPRAGKAPLTKAP